MPRATSSLPSARRLRATTLLVAAGLLLPLAGCGGGQGLRGQSASQVLGTAVTAATRAGPFHFVDNDGSGSAARLVVGDTGTTSAQETLSVGRSVELVAALVGGVGYVKASEQTLESLFGLPTAQATRERGKWVSVTDGEKGYSRIVQSLTPAAELDNYIPQEPLEVGSPTTLRGIAVIPVSGRPAASESTSSTLQAVATLFVSVRSPNVPVGAVVSGTDVHGRKVREEVAFTRWGEDVHVITPTGTVPLASLLG